MKNIILILTIVVLQLSCKKDAKICTTYTELSDRSHLVDPITLGDSALIDTLNNRPELQVYKITSDQYGWVVRCNVFYKTLKVFTSQVNFNRRNGGSIVSLNYLDFGSINFNLTPTISYESAITTSIHAIDFSKTCISYRLGIYDLNSGSSFQPKNYKLVWKIQGESGYPYVILDANTLEVYLKDDGIRY